MTAPQVWGAASWFCGSGGKTLGLLRARGRGGSRFESVGAFDIDPLACQDFERLTGARAMVLDLGAVTVEELRRRHTRRPDVIVMSPPCKGFSGCLPEGVSQTDKYQALNLLALRAIMLAVETWEVPPAALLLENVPRMKNRGARLLEQIRAVLRAANYETDLRAHDCGEIGGLAQSRSRLLLVARHRELAPTPLLVPPSKGMRSMASVLWRLPVPVPGSEQGGKHHRLPRLSPLNWLRLASTPAGCDWRAIPAAVHVGLDIDARLLPGDERRHAGKYGVQRPDSQAHAVIAEVRTGKGWADVADPRVAERDARQNGGRGVNDAGRPAHAVMGEGSVSNTWASVTDPRLEYTAREGGSHGVADARAPICTVLGRPGNGTAAVADPRSECVRREDSIGVSDPGAHYKTAVIGHQKIENSPSSVADPRVAAQHRGNYGVQDPEQASACIRASHPPRTAPSSIADDRPLFAATHELVAGQRWTGDREAWIAGVFWLLGPALNLQKSGRTSHVIIRAPDGTVHRPLTTLELAVLQGFPAWHRPGDPTELELGADGGQWLELAGNDAQVREHIGNAVPPASAQAIGQQLLEVLDAGKTIAFRLSAAGIWVEPKRATQPTVNPEATERRIAE